MNKYFKLIELFIDNDDISRNNANFVRGVPVLEHVVVGEVMKDYLFDVIYKGLPVRIHHEEGWAYHHQTYRLSAYSYSPVNQLIVREGDEVKLLSFEELYESLPEEEILVDEEKEVYQKELSNREIFVLDRKGWTRLLRITKKRREKDIVVVKTRMGEMVEVTADHPCIVGEDKDRDAKPAQELLPFEDKQFRVEVAPFLKDYLFKVEEVDAAELIEEEGLLITEDFVILKPSENSNLNGMKRRVKLSEELGYFIGFFLAEGYVKTFGGIPSSISIVQKEKKTLEKLQKILFKECGVYSSIGKAENGYALSVPNRAFIAFLKNFVSYGRAPQKRLSPRILRYSKEFLKGIVAGLLDGDGTLNAHGQISLRLSSPKLTYQLSYIFQILGYPPAMRFEECKNTTNKYGITQRRPLYGVMFTYKQGYETLPSEKFKRAVEWKRERGIGDNEFYRVNDWVSVQSVRRIENELTLSEYEFVYDITTESHTFVLHNLWVHNCIGLSAKDIAFYGLQSNAKNERRAAPPKRLETLFMQCANLICLIAQEVSGATSLNDLSTVAAGYLYYLEKEGRKSYSDYELENLWQEFLYNINLPFRSGNSPFSNITLDFGKPNSRLRYEPVVYAGKLLDITYEKIPPYYFDRINTAFIKAMRRGDADGNPFTFPLITVNITEDFDRNNPAWKLLLKESEYFGGFYVQNYLKEPFTKPSKYKEKNPFIKPFDEGMIYSNCCLDPETKLFVYTEGKELPDWITLREIKEKFTGRVISQGSSEKWWEVKGLSVPSINPKTGKIEKKKITKLLQISSKKEVKIKFRNGFEMTCDPSHRVAVFSPEEKRITWKPACEVRPGDFGLSIKRALSEAENYEKLSDGTPLNEEIAWFFGYFYAEGCFIKDSRNREKVNGIVLTAGLKERDKLKKAEDIALKYFGDKISSTNYYTEKWQGKESSVQLWIYGRALGEFLLKNGVVKYAEIPPALKSSPKSVVESFLKGFIDGDGYTRGGHTELHVNDESLIRELSSLLWAHGIRHTLRVRENSQTLKLSKPTKSSCYSLVPSTLIREKSVVTPSGNRSYIKTPTVSEEFIRKYRLDSGAIKDYREWDVEIIKVESVEERTLKEPKTYLDIEVEDNETFILANGIVSFNCRMLFDISQVEAVTGSNPFHSGSGVGGIGVYAINLNRLLFLAKDDFEFLKRMIDYTMEVGAKALQRKREWLRKHWKDLFPYLSFYQKDDRSLFNIFSVVGVHEGMVNAGFKDGLFNDEAKEYAHRIAQYLYKKLHQFMERDKVLYSLEYAPSENAACRMAEKDIAFANALAEVLNGQRKPEISKDPYLNLFIKEAITKFGENLFERVEVEDESR
ncbi:anaerobic ribonucleoside-triphosphate reductase [Thermovibrio sp.]